MIALDQNLGFNNSNTSVAIQAATLTTGATAAPGTRIIAQVSCWDTSAQVPTMTIGGVAATIDAGPFTNPSQRSWVFSLFTPLGLAAGSAITVNFAAFSVIALALNASSWFGMQSTTGYVETSGGGTLTDTTHWLTPTVAVASPEALLFAFATTDGQATTATSTATAPATEIHDYWNTATEATTTAYRVVTPGSYSIGGTWTVADSQRVTGIVAYKAAPDSAQRFKPLPFQARGRNL